MKYYSESRLGMPPSPTPVLVVGVCTSSAGIKRQECKIWTLPHLKQLFNVFVNSFILESRAVSDSW